MIARLRATNENANFHSPILLLSPGISQNAARGCHSSSTNAAQLESPPASTREIRASAFSIIKQSLQGRGKGRLEFSEQRKFRSCSRSKACNWKRCPPNNAGNTVVESHTGFAHDS